MYEHRSLAHLPYTMQYDQSVEWHDYSDRQLIKAVKQGMKGCERKDLLRLIDELALRLEECLHALE